MSTDSQTIYSRLTHHVVRSTVLGHLCNVHASVREDVDTSTGDQTIAVSIDDIIAISGQTLLTRAVPVEEFRDLCAQVRLHHTVVTEQQ